MECNKSRPSFTWNRSYSYSSCVFLLCSHLYEWRLSRKKGLHRTIVTVCFSSL